VVTTPALLGMKPESLRYKWRLLLRMASQYGPWQMTVAYNSPSSLAILMTYSEARLLRLQYLLETESKDWPPMIATVMKPEALFRQEHPGWTEWCGRQQQRPGAEGEARAVRVGMWQRSRHTARMGAQL
jgi:hypothetical protein